MAGYEPDSWSAGDTAEDTDERAPATDGGTAGSLMSVQIRRSRPARKRPPCGPAAAPEPERQAPIDEPQEPAPSQANRATPPAPAPGELPAAQQTRQPEEITAYWSRLRGNRPYPSVSDLDSDRIAVEWPNSILFRCRSGSRALEPDMSFIPRQGGAAASLDRGGETGKIDLSPMMLQWLLSLAGEVVRNCRPVEDTESFPSAQRSIGYRAIALPLSENNAAVDHVLCHVRQA
jgi:hypothetical protein